MAPKKTTDSLIWVVLGIGGLYLLSQNDESKDTTIAVTTDDSPGPDSDMDEDPIHLTFGEGALTKGPELTYPKKPKKKDGPEFEPAKESGGTREGTRHPFHNQTLYRQYQKIHGDAAQLDREVANVFRLYHSRRGKDLGELGQGMEQQVHETLSKMITLSANLERFLGHAGISSTNEGRGMYVTLQAVRKRSKDFEKVLARSQINERENRAQLTADVFLRMFVDVRRSLRHHRLRDQFLQQLPHGGSSQGDHGL